MILVIIYSKNHEEIKKTINFKNVYVMGCDFTYAVNYVTRLSEFFEYIIFITWDDWYPVDQILDFDRNVIFIAHTYNFPKSIFFTSKQELIYKINDTVSNLFNKLKY